MALIPQQAHLYLPAPTQIMNEDGTRLLFEGLPYTDKEKTALLDFWRHLDRRGVRLACAWPESAVLRFLQARRWDVEKAASNIQ
jgi:hypothetical protein